VFDFGFTLSSQRYFTVCPPECPDWVELFQKHVFSGDTHLFDRWMDGAIGAEAVASLMAPIVGMAERDVLDCMERGLVGLHTNAAVVKLANAVKRMGKRTILVTGNIDLFDTIVVPDLDLASTFDVIVNSSRSKSSFKLSLWDEAFALPERWRKLPQQLSHRRQPEKRGTVSRRRRPGQSLSWRRSTDRFPE
jgi:hypothetical protein